MSLEEVNNRKNVADQSEKYLRELTKTFTGIEKPLKNEKIAETLDDLIAELHNVFNSDRVNIEYVNHLLLSYKSNPTEWKKFAKFDRFKWVFWDRNWNIKNKLLSRVAIILSHNRHNSMRVFAFAAK